MLGGTRRGGKGFMAYLQHYGLLDNMLGISMFWSEKFVVIFLYFHRLALLLLWQLNWPVYFYRRLTFMFALLLDFTAHHENVDALGKGTFFEGCETICKISWPGVCLPVLFLWAGISLHRTMPLYYARNIERMLWTVVRLGLLPFMNTLVRYYILNQNGNLDDLNSHWTTPTSEMGSVFMLLTVFLFLYLAFVRSRRQVLFRSRIRHEAFIRARELEYKLRFSCTYRNERIWMISSYNYAAWPWSIIRGGIDIMLLLVINFVPVKVGSIIGCVILWLNLMYGLFFVSLYRCWSTNAIEHVLNFAIAVFCTIGVLQVYEVRNPLLVDRNLDYFLLGLHGGACGLVLIMMIYFFFHSHIFWGSTVADKRAAAKWKFQFGGSGLVKMAAAKVDRDEDDPDDHEEMEKLKNENYMQNADEIRPLIEEEENFYVPKEAGFLSLNCESPHVWPVNGIVINELLKRNSEDHLVDMLRAGKKMLDRISALHGTAMLIPINELKSHIKRLQECVAYCKRQRVTHHMNAIHPLQSTFEDMIEHFTFELRVFSGKSITVGHNARKMIEVSRYLRKRMLARDETLALISPLMRRVLIKLLALRIFIQLVEERPAFLLPGQKREEEQFVAPPPGFFDGSTSNEGSRSHSTAGSFMDFHQTTRDGAASKSPQQQDFFGNMDASATPQANNIDVFGQPLDDDRRLSWTAGDSGKNQITGEQAEENAEEEERRYQEMMAAGAAQIVEESKKER